MRAAVFIDRDGTVIEDLHYPREAEKVSLIPQAIEGLKLLSQKGYLLFIVSNQSGVGRGIISEKQFQEVHEKCCELLKNAGINIAEFVYCFHHPEDPCSCRKPKTGLIPRSFSDEKIDFKKSFTVGDRPCDLELGDNLGAQGCLVLSGKGLATFNELKENGKERQYKVASNLHDLAKELPQFP